MIEDYSIRIYWGRRPESPGECAARLRDTFEALSAVESLFGDWREKVRAKPQDAPPVPVSEDALTEYVAEQEDDVVPESLGYELSVWAGEPDGLATDLRINCGGASDSGNNVNSVVLSVPVSEDQTEAFLECREMIQLLEGLVVCWEPEWGVVTTFELDEALDEFDLRPHEPIVGWMSYLDGDRPEVPELSDAYEVERDFGGGTLIVADEEPLWSSNDEDVERVRDLQKRLREAGVMRPIFADE